MAIQMDKDNTKDNSFERFTNLYPISKTLRFELKPIGKTLENIYSSGILKTDENRAESYKIVKKIIDRYHKAFIENVLKDVRLELNSVEKKNSLQEYYELYMTSSKNDVQKKEFNTVQDNLRKQISTAFSKHEKFKTIDKKKLIQNDLLDFAYSEEEKLLVKKFHNFTTYFTGFHENRMNMYSTEAKSTAISYRLIHENLPKYIDNINVYKKLVDSPIPIAEKINELNKTFANEGYINVDSIAKMFTLDGYTFVLTQSQIEMYNAIIGGKTEEDGTKIQGLNEYINLYNQQQTSKEKRLPKLKPLFKQILSDREQVSWLQEEFVEDREVLVAVNEFYGLLADDLLERTRTLLQSIPDYDINKIYISNDLQLTDISQKMFGDWGMIRRAIEKDYESKHPQRKTNSEVYEDRKAKFIKSIDSFSIGYINDCLSLLNPEYKNVDAYFENIGAINSSDQQNVNIITRIKTKYQQAYELLNTEYSTNTNLAQDKPNVSLLKNLLDAIKDLQRFIKPLLGKGDEPEKDEKFYGELAYIWEMIDKATPLYNKVRNYVTRKPYSTEKMKVNFDNAQLLDGWDENKESTNACIILKRNGLYYLAIADKDHRKLLDKKMPDDGDCYEKMIYKQFDITKQVPKCTTELKAVKKGIIDNGYQYVEVYDKKKWNTPFVVQKELWELNNFVWDQNTQSFVIRKKDNETRPKKFHKKYLEITNDCQGYKEATIKWIDFVKEFLTSYKSTSLYNVISKPSSEYDSVDEFYSFLDCELYNISFAGVSVSYINTLVDEGKLYLFQIYNKDFSPYSKGTPNMHTLYWNMLFDERNLSDVVYKLNGMAEIFFRKSSIKAERPTHPAHLPINNKNAENPKKQSVFEYDLIKDKRGCQNRFAPS